MIIYQVYPRSYADSGGYGVGDLKGLRERLGHIAALGAELVWVSPFFPSPMKDFGYDVSDYCGVDPLFGTMADFDELVAEAKRLGLGLMLDLVLSHTSDEHPWFRESRSGRDNPRADWYVWADPAPGVGPPNNWLSLFGGPAWEWDAGRRQYYLHNFLKSQPDLNFHQPTVQEALLSSCEFWFRKGVKGMRLDVCNFYFHSAGLEDNPARPRGARDTEGVHPGNPYNAQLHVYDKDRPENLLFLERLRALADRFPGTTLMGEVVSDDSLEVMKSYISGGKPLHTAYNFSLFAEGFSGPKLASGINAAEAAMPAASPSWALSNHDVPRYLTRLGGAGAYPASARAFLMLLFSLKGNVIVYQGDELGLDEAVIPRRLMQDPFGIEFYPEFKGRDGCRTPLPWDAAGTAWPRRWLPIPDSHAARCVELQEKSGDSVLSFARRLCAWRRANPWLDSAPVRASAPAGAVLQVERDLPDGRRFLLLVNGGGNVFTHPALGAVGPFGWSAAFSGRDGGLLPFSL